MAGIELARIQLHDPFATREVYGIVIEDLGGGQKHVAVVDTAVGSIVSSAVEVTMASQTDLAALDSRPGRPPRVLPRERRRVRSRPPRAARGAHRLAARPRAR